MTSVSEQLQEMIDGLMAGMGDAEKHEKGVRSEEHTSELQSQA